MEIHLGARPDVISCTMSRLFPRMSSVSYMCIVSPCACTGTRTKNELQWISLIFFSWSIRPSRLVSSSNCYTLVISLKCSDWLYMLSQPLPHWSTRYILLVLLPFLYVMISSLKIPHPHHHTGPVRFLSFMLYSKVTSINCSENRIYMEKLTSASM